MGEKVSGLRVSESISEAKSKWWGKSECGVERDEWTENERKRIGERNRERDRER